MAEKHKALYLKYRPQSFLEVIGQDHIKKTLQQAVISGNVAHAYLFAGSRGTGKTTTARILAKTINCPNQKDGEPCNKCEFCEEIISGKSMDIIEIDAASNRGIDEIRDLREKIKYSPSKLKFKVYIIDEVHMLTKEAFNALLKTLEEPPEHAIFILATTEIHKVPETILSRCQRFDFYRIKISDLVKYLSYVAKKENLEIEDGVLDLIAANSQGAHRDAINLLDQASGLGKKVTLDTLKTILGLTDVLALNQFIGYLINNDLTNAVSLVNELLEKGYDLHQFSKKLIEYLRYILIIKLSADTGLIEQTKEEVDILKDYADRIKLDRLALLLNNFIQAERAFTNALIPQLPLEMAAINSCESDEQKQEAKKITGDILEDWQLFVEELKKHNASLGVILADSKIKNIDKNQITLSTEFDIYKDKINDVENRAIIEALIKKMTGKVYKIKCI